MTNDMKTYTLVQLRKGKQWTQKEAAKCAAGAGAHKDVAGLPTKN